MATNAGRERIYSETEVRALISRAVERHQADLANGQPEHGLTLSDIERVLSEIGIDPKYAALAASDLQAPERTVSGNSFWGAPLSFELERTVDGELTDDIIAEMAYAIRSLFRSDRGQLETIGRSFEWSKSPHSGERLTVFAKSEDGKIRIHIHQHFTEWALLWHMGGLLASIFAVLFAIRGVFIEILTAILTVISLFFAGKIAMRVHFNRRTAKLEKLMDQLAGIAAASTTASAKDVQSIADSTATASQARIQLGHREPEVAETSTVRRRARA